MGRKASITKEDIIESALDCFLEKGFEETTFKEIAAKLKVSQPLLYTYFKHKMDLLGACSLWAAQRGRQVIDGGINPKAPAAERLNQYLSGNLNFFRKNSKDAFAVSAIYFFAQTDESVRNIYEQIQKASIERFEANLLQISYEKGKQIKNSVLLAETIQSIMVGEIYKVIYLKSNRNWKAREEAVLEQIQVLVESALV